MRDTFESAFRESIRIKEDFLKTGIDSVIEASQMISRQLQTGRKILLFGNGGSAADSQHLAAEFVNRLGPNARPAIPAIALTTDTSILTSIANDFCFERIFARQIEAYGKPGDIAFGISTSGNSDNILEAFKTARRLDLICIGLLGGDGGKARDLIDIGIIVNHHSSQRIQEVHLLIEHLLCESVEELLYGPFANG